MKAQGRLDERLLLHRSRGLHSMLAIESRGRQPSEHADKPPRTKSGKPEYRNHMPESRLIKCVEQECSSPKSMNNDHFDMYTELNSVFRRVSSRTKVRQVWSRSRVNYYHGRSGCQHSSQQIQLLASPRAGCPDQDRRCTSDPGCLVRSRAPPSSESQ